MSAAIRAGANDSALQQGGSDAVPFNIGGVTSKIQKITGSVAASALTAALKPCVLDFRNATLTDGEGNTRLINSEINLIVPSGATLGTVDTIQSRLILLAIDNAGTVELAIVNSSGGNDLSETGVISTTALSTGSDSANVIYSTTARTNVAYRVIGFIESTQATAGTWATSPSLIQGAGGLALTELNLRSGAEIATTSGTSHDYTGIPSWVKRITLSLNGVDTNGTDASNTSSLIVQIGDSGGIETTGYVSEGAYMVSGGNATYATTIGFLLGKVDTAHVPTNGHLILTLVGTNTWVASFSGTNNYPIILAGAGRKQLSGTLDRIRLTAVNGTDTFNAGSINIFYE